jgi:hypothetical protein
MQTSVRFLNLKAICTYEKSKKNQPSHEKKWKYALSFYIYSIELYATHFSEILVNCGISFLK